MFIELLKLLEQKEVSDISQINTALADDVDIRTLKTYHAILLVKSQEGMRNLYNIISRSHLDYFYKKPRAPKSLIQKYRGGLIVGSACEAGELYRAILENPYNMDYAKINEIVNFYDYLEIQPLGNNSFLLRDGKVESTEISK